MKKQGPESKQLSQVPRPFKELSQEVQAAQAVWLQSQAVTLSGSATISLGIGITCPGLSFLTATLMGGLRCHLNGSSLTLMFYSVISIR